VESALLAAAEAMIWGEAVVHCIPKKNIPYKKSPALVRGITSCFSTGP
jgi:hypothetical protein